MLRHGLGGDAGGLGKGRDVLGLMGQKLMERWVEQPDRHRQAVHDLEQFDEVLALHGQQPEQRLTAAFLILGHNHLAHSDDTVLVEEHVLGAAQSDPFGAVMASGLGIGRGFCVGAHLHAAHLIGPFDDLAKITGKLGLDGLHLAQHNLAGAAVDGDLVALLDGGAMDRHGSGLGVNDDTLGRTDTGATHAPGNHCGVAGHAATGGENTLGRVHAVDIVGAGFHADQNHRLLGSMGLGRVGGEHDRAMSGTGGGRHALGNDVAIGLGVDHGMEKLLQGNGVDALQGLAFRDQSFLFHVHGDLQCRSRGALSGTGLEHPQLVFLNRELHVLHLAVMEFELAAHLVQLSKNIGHALFHGGQIRVVGILGVIGQRVRRTDASHHVLALGVN